MWEDQFWHEMRRIRKVIDLAFGSDDFPQSDVDNFRFARACFEEENNDYIITVEIPGIKKEEIRLETGENNELIVKAERKQEIKKDTEKNRYHSRQYAGFYRLFKLPDDADMENLDTLYEDGVLKISIPKNKEIV